MRSIYLAPWEPGASYHVFNRAVALNRLFCSWDNVAKFRAVLTAKVKPVFAIYSLSLVGNHFHLHGRVRSLDELEAYLRSLSKPLKRQRRYLDGEIGFQEFIGDAFARAFHAYGRSFNIHAKRTGSLMDQTVRRLRVRDDLLSRRLCVYHHANAMKHGLYPGYTTLKGLTTYAEIVKGASDLVDLEAVYARFGGVEAFVRFHETSVRRHARNYAEHDELRHFGYENYPERFSYQLNRGEHYLWCPEPDDDPW